MNVEREVSRSVFTSFAGALLDLGRYEKQKEHPDYALIEFYELVINALSFEHRRFSKYTAENVEYVFKNLSPILKSMVLAKTTEEREQIVQYNKNTLIAIIEKKAIVIHPIRESVGSPFSDLSFLSENLQREERNKVNPDSAKLKMYETLFEVTWRFFVNFNKLTNEQLIVLSKAMLPIAEAIINSNSKYESICRFNTEIQEISELIGWYE